MIHKDFCIFKAISIKEEEAIVNHKEVIILKAIVIKEEARSIACVVKVRRSRKHRPLRTTYTVGDVRNKAKTELKIKPFIEMKSFGVEVILVESLPDKVLLYNVHG